MKFCGCHDFWHILVSSLFSHTFSHFFQIGAKVIAHRYSFKAGTSTIIVQHSTRGINKNNINNMRRKQKPRHAGKQSRVGNNKGKTQDTNEDNEDNTIHLNEESNNDNNTNTTPNGLVINDNTDNENNITLLHQVTPTKRKYNESEGNNNNNINSTNEEGNDKDKEDSNNNDNNKDNNKDNEHNVSDNNSSDEESNKKETSGGYKSKFYLCMFTKSSFIILNFCVSFPRC